MSNIRVFFLRSNSTSTVFYPCVVRGISPLSLSEGAYYHTPNGGLRPPFSKKPLTIYQARRALKIPFCVTARDTETI